MELFSRKIELFINDSRFIYPEFDIDFQISFDDDPEPNMSDVSIFNLSNNIINKIYKGDRIILNAGYQNDTGSILIGTIEEVNTELNRTDRMTKFIVGDGSHMWANTTISKAYSSGIKASHLIRDVLKGFGLEIGEISLGKDIVYNRGKTLSGTLSNSIKEIALETNSKFYIKNGVIFIRPQLKGTQTGFLLNADTGLIGSPQRIVRDDKEGYFLTMLLNHKINTDSIVRVESKFVSGDFLVAKGKHNGNFITECEVFPL